MADGEEATRQKLRVRRAHLWGESGMRGLGPGEACGPGAAGAGRGGCRGPLRPGPGRWQGACVSAVSPEADRGMRPGPEAAGPARPLPQRLGIAVEARGRRRNGAETPRPEAWLSGCPGTGRPATGARLSPASRAPGLAPASPLWAPELWFLHVASAPLLSGTCPKLH